MKIALAQIDIKAGDPDTNLATMERFISRASEQGVDIVCYPEMCVGGYLVGDLWLDDDWCHHLMSYNDKIRKLSKKYKIGIIYGNICILDDIKPSKEDRLKKWSFCNYDGRSLKFNAAYAVQNGKAVKRRIGSKYLPEGVQPKTLLPTYRYFDDERYFMSAWDFAGSYEDGFFGINSPFKFIINKEEKYVGAELCEDMWWKDYNLNPSFAFAATGAEVIINISASPWTFNKNKARDKRVAKLLDWSERKWWSPDFIERKTGKEYKPKNYEKIVDGKTVGHSNVEGVQPIRMVETPSYPPFAYVNCVGAQNNGKNILVFDGASTVYGRDGKPKIFANADYKEELLIFDHEEIPQRMATRKREYPIPRKYQAIIRGIKHISEVTGIYQYFIALSGGTDSGVSAALLVDALGNKNVIAVNMPTRHNSPRTRTAAQKIAQRLNICYIVFDIEKFVAANNGLVAVALNENLSDLTKENIQAKIRTTAILSNIAGQRGALFPCNGNKLEVALGYATLYGDWGGAIAPIADLTKTEVYQMAAYLNKIHKKNPIPKNLLPDRYYQFGKNKIKPSAELKADQVDPIKIGYHCALIEQFMDYMKKSPADIMQWHIDGTLAKKLKIPPKLLEIYGLNDPKVFIEDLKWVCTKMRGSIFKRVQSVPIIVLTKTAFGYDLRESILPRYKWTTKAKELEEKILKNVV